MKNFQTLCSTLFLAYVPALAAQSVLTPTVLQHPDHSADLTLTIQGPPRGVAALLMAPTRSLPAPTPWGLLYTVPPIVVATVPLDATGRVALTFHIPANEVGATAAFQAVTVDPGFTLVRLSDYVLAGSRGSAIGDQGQGAAGSYDKKNNQWGVCFAGRPGMPVRVTRGPGVREVLANGVIGANGYVWFHGDLDDSPQGPLGGAEQFQVEMNGVPWMNFR